MRSLQVPILCLLLSCAGLVAAAEQSDVRHTLPPGWVGIQVRNKQSMTDGSGVHVGRGRVLTAAHLFASFSRGSSIAVYRASGMMEPIVSARARLLTANEHEDLAIVQIDDATGFETSAPCTQPPAPGEEVDFLRMNRDRGVMAGIVSMRATFDGLRTIPAYPKGTAVGKLSGRKRYAFAGVAEPGMSGGGAYAQDGACFYGIISLVDPSANEGRAVTFVAPPSTFGRLMQGIADTLGLSMSR